MSGLHTTDSGGSSCDTNVSSPHLQAQNGSSDFDPPLYRRALVVFGGRCGVLWLRWLKPGFRHCFVAADDGAQWLTVDPLLHRLEIRATGLASDFDLAAAYRNMNLVVIEFIPSAVRRRTAPIGAFTCVETVKRLLGLRAAWVLTPWQLFRLLQRRNGHRMAGIRTKQENILDIPTSGIIYLTHADLDSTRSGVLGGASWERSSTLPSRPKAKSESRSLESSEARGSSCG